MWLGGGRRIRHCRIVVSVVQGAIFRRTSADGGSRGHRTVVGLRTWSRYFQSKVRFPISYRHGRRRFTGGVRFLRDKINDAQLVNTNNIMNHAAIIADTTDSAFLF